MNSSVFLPYSHTTNIISLVNKFQHIKSCNQHCFKIQNRVLQWPWVQNHIFSLPFVNHNTTCSILKLQKHTTEYLPLKCTTNEYPSLPPHLILALLLPVKDALGGKQASGGVEVELRGVLQDLLTNTQMVANLAIGSWVLVLCTDSDHLLHGWAPVLKEIKCDVIQLTRKMNCG